MSAVCAFSVFMAIWQNSSLITKERKMAIFDFIKLRKRIAALERENKKLKERAERAEQFWGERQKDVMALTVELQNERLRSAKRRADDYKQVCRLFKLIRKRLFGKFNITMTANPGMSGDVYCLEKGIALIFSPQAVISLFCGLLGLPKELFWENIKNEGWEMCLRGRLRDNKGIMRRDDFSDLGGRLSADSHCGMCRHKKEE
jgi:hypothetical protein